MEAMDSKSVSEIFSKQLPIPQLVDIKVTRWDLEYRSKLGLEGGGRFPYPIQHLIIILELS